MYWVKTPKLIKKAFPQLLWEMPPGDLPAGQAGKTLYLTFDDGPQPDQTTFVLEQLKAYDARATFFCLGKNIERYPTLFEQIIDAGHSIGNHSYHHLNGWETDDESYFLDIDLCQPLTGTNLLRPPYGRITPSQIDYLKDQYQIVLWDVLSGDFDHHLSPEDCLHNVISHASPGSIIVFHDSVKAKANLTYALPKVLEHFSDKGVTFASLPSTSL